MKICRDKIYGIGKLYEYEGKVYRSPKRLAETYGLPWQSLAHFLARCDTVDEAMKRCIEQQEHKIILWGKEYRDRFEVAEAFGINQDSISYGISCKKMSLEETVLDLLSWKPIWFEGKKYSTIVDLCACYQVQSSNVMKRLTDFSKMIGMLAAPFNTYKFKHNCRDIIETLQKMQKDRIPAY